MKEFPVWKISGWVCAAFLAGIAMHSPWPYARLGMETMTVAGLCLLILLYLAPSSRIRLAIIMIMACVIGLWRFESAGQPKNLRFLDPKGFAYERAEPNEWRLRLTERVERGLPGDPGALLAGILYGERSLSKDVRQEFRMAGMSHLIAVSGSNVMILVIALMRLFQAFRLSRKNAFIWLTASLVSFVWIVSPQAPVVRASIMGWLIAYAPMVGRLPSTNRLLLVSAVAFAAWKPWSLVYDPSFALSFLATIGLLTWGRWIDSRLEKKLPWAGLRETVSMTIGATLMTAPYAAWAFGQTSMIGLLTNILAIPIVPWAMGSGVLVLLAPYEPFTLPALGFLRALLWIAEMAASIPGASWNITVSPAFTLACYVVIWFAWKKLSTATANKIIHNP